MRWWHPLACVTTCKPKTAHALLLCVCHRWQGLSVSGVVHCAAPLGLTPAWDAKQASPPNQPPNQPSLPPAMPAAAECCAPPHLHLHPSTTLLSHPGRTEVARGPTLRSTGLPAPYPPEPKCRCKPADHATCLLGAHICALGAFWASSKGFGPCCRGGQAGAEDAPPPPPPPVMRAGPQLQLPACRPCSVHLWR